MPTYRSLRVRAYSLSSIAHDRIEAQKRAGDSTAPRTCKQAGARLRSSKESENMLDHPHALGDKWPRILVHTLVLALISMRLASRQG